MHALAAMIKFTLYSRQKEKAPPGVIQDYHWF